MTTIRELREGKQISQERLAALAHCSTATISRIERGGRPMPAIKNAIAAALGVTPDEITEPALNRVRSGAR